MKWIKASERLPGYRHNYHVRVGYEYLKGQPGIWNTASLWNGTYWEHPTEYDWAGNPKKANVVEWLDESDEFQSPERVSDERGISTNPNVKEPKGSYSPSLSTPSEQEAIAEQLDGAIEDYNYWKKRCEAAENILSHVPIDGGLGRSNIYLAGFDNALQEWQSLKSAK